jgi:acetyl esterase/lipase
MKYLCSLLLLFVLGKACLQAAEPKVELLWPQGAPGAKGNAPADKPTLTVFLPDPQKATGAAVVICPGGGYEKLSVDFEGSDVAKWFNSFGVAGFVLEYRHRGRGYGHPAPMQDGQRAIRMVRARAAEWNVAPDRVGIMGFSAGGHLASTIGTHFDKGSSNSADPIERVGCRPDFLILCYAVTVFEQPYRHRQGSEPNLLGKNAKTALVWSLSNEKQVTPETPPTFLYHTDADDDVSPEQSVQFYLALHRAGVPAELHIYRAGPHGAGLAADIPATCTWPDRLKDWMKGLGLLTAKR